MNEPIESYRQGSVLSAALFIASTNTGVAYFIVPVLTGMAGFIPAILITLLVWAFTLAVGLLFAEATLGQPDGSHLISISRALLGKTWMVIIAIVFLINMISYLTTYTYFIEKTLTWFFHETFHITLHPAFIGLLGTLALFSIVFLGMKSASRVNSVLIFALLLSFSLTIFAGSPFVEKKLLGFRQWEYLFFSVPILFSAFGFAGIVPPICTYLKRDPKRIRLAMGIGTLIPLGVYLVWQWFVIGSIQAGSFWLLHEEGVDMEKVLSLIQKFPNITYPLHFTLFFSMTTSMIGNGLGTVEFLSDGFKIPLDKRRGWKRLLICLAIVAIILPFSLIREQTFFTIIQNFTSPIGEVLIDGFIPVWMVAQARYAYNSVAPRMLPGRHISLMILGVAIFILIYLEGIEFIRT